MTSPFVLRDYALLADGERGALIDPRGRIVWMCAPRWHDDAVFSTLIGGSGEFGVSALEPWHVWGGQYEDGTLIYNSRWVLTDGVIECRQAMALPAAENRAVILRRIRAVDGDAHVKVRLDARAGFGDHPMKDLHRSESGTWQARSGNLWIGLTGAHEATADRDGALSAELILAEDTQRDLVLQVGREAPAEAIDADELWSATEAAWAQAVPDCSDLPATRDVRLAYAVLHGLTSRDGGMVAAATTSLPERSKAGRSYDYRYAWVRDQCYAGNALAAHGGHPLMDRTVSFVTQRLLDDGPALRPAYCVNGASVPEERTLDLPGYPGGTDRIGNDAADQFQLDVFGEALSLFAAAARLDRLDGDAVRAAHIAADAVADHWDEPDAGIWELEPAWWTHSRLAVAVGLHAAGSAVPGGNERGWQELAAKIVDVTKQRCRNRRGYWQRSADDPGIDAAVLRPLTLNPRLFGPKSLARTRQMVHDTLTQDGYVYRFRHDEAPLDEAEGAFLLCGLFMARACQAEGRYIDAARWFERTRSACGSPGLFAEEYDVRQRQLRGNLPQAFVHALLLETAAFIAKTPAPS